MTGEIGVGGERDADAALEAPPLLEWPLGVVAGRWSSGGAGDDAAGGSLTTRLGTDISGGAGDTDIGACVGAWMEQGRGR